MNVSVGDDQLRQQTRLLIGKGLDFPLVGPLTAGCKQLLPGGSQLRHQRIDLLAFKDHDVLNGFSLRLASTQGLKN